MWLPFCHLKKMGLLATTLKYIIFIGSSLWKQFVRVIIWVGETSLLSTASDDISNDDFYSTSPYPKIIQKSPRNSFKNTENNTFEDFIHKNNFEAYSLFNSDATSHLDNHIKLLIKEKYASGTSINKKGTRNTLTYSANDVKCLSPLQENVLASVQVAKFNSGALSCIKPGIRSSSISSALSIDLSCSSKDRSLQESSRGTSRTTGSPSPVGIRKSIKENENIPHTNRALNVPSKKETFSAYSTSDTDEDLEKHYDQNKGKYSGSRNVQTTFNIEKIPQFQTSLNFPSDVSHRNIFETLESENKSNVPAELIDHLSYRNPSHKQIASEGHPKCKGESTFIKKNVTCGDSLSFTNYNKGTPKIDVTILKDEIVALREEICARKGKLASCSVPLLSASQEKCFISSVEDISNLRKEISALKSDFLSLFQKDKLKNEASFSNMKKIIVNNISRQTILQPCQVKSTSIDSLKYSDDNHSSLVRRLDSFGGFPLKGTAGKNYKKFNDVLYKREHARISRSENPFSNAPISYNEPVPGTIFKRVDSFKGSSKSKLFREKRENKYQSSFSSERARAFQPNAATMIPLKGDYLKFSKQVLQSVVRTRLRCLNASEEQWQFVADFHEEESDSDSDNGDWSPTQQEISQIKSDELIMYGLCRPPFQIKNVK